MFDLSFTHFLIFILYSLLSLTIYILHCIGLPTTSTHVSACPPLPPNQLILARSEPVWTCPADREERSDPLAPFLDITLLLCILLTSNKTSLQQNLVFFLRFCSSSAKCCGLDSSPFRCLRLTQSGRHDIVRIRVTRRMLGALHCGVRQSLAPWA